MAYDAVKAAQVSAYIKQGYTEDQAFEKAGITAADDAYYSVDGVKNSPTYGQVIKGPAATNYTEEQLAADKARSDASRKSWEDTEVQAKTTGPTVTRVTNDVVTTGGTERVTKTTPEMAAWQEKSRAADSADAAQTQANKDEYLRSKGLDNASPSAKRAAIKEAQANGTNFDSTANKDSLEPPPKKQYTDPAITPNETGEQTPNDGTQTDDQASKNSAAGQTAEQKVNNDAPQASTGEGTPPSDIADPQPVSDEEAAKIKDDNDPTKDPYEAPPPEGSPSEASAETSDNSNKTKQQKTDTVKGDAGVSGQKTDSDKDKEKSGIVISVGGAPPMNMLHAYSSYTYRISLFFLEKDDYNSLAAGPDQFTPKYALMSSGGGYAGKPGPDIKINDTLYRGAGRHPDFEEDFFIDNLSILTVVGLNSKTKATNAIEISFTITEPHGISLLDRLLSACETSNDKSLNYMEQPYLLEVDFLASPTDPYYNNSKTQDRLIARKRIPIKFLELKINPSTGGTVYQVRAIPYNHVAFNMSVASVPVNFNIEAGNVGEFFSTDTDAVDLINGFQQQISANKERVESELVKWKAEHTIIEGGARREPTPAQIEAERTRLTKSISYDSTSFVGAYNEYMKEVSKQGLSKNPPTLIAFNIPDQRIAKSPIVNPETAQSRNNTMGGREQAIETSDNQYKKKQVFPIHPGTSIIDVVDKIVQKSDYITSQINELQKQVEESAANASYSNTNTENDRSGTSAKKIDEKFQDLDWFKVIPQVVLSDFDFNRNAYSKTVLYTILPYTTANQYHPSFKKSQIKESAAVRTYDYWYTGKNMDIIKADIDFDSTYYTQLTTYRDQVKRGGANRQSSEEAVDITTAGTNAAIRSAILPVTTEVGGHNAAAGTMNSAEQPKDHLVADLKKSLYSSQRGDMLNIKLTIIGDPAYIKQDDIYYNPAAPDAYNKYLTTTEPNALRPIGDKGQILFDREQVYVKLNFKNVVDINDAIGIVNKQTKLTNGRDTNGTFTGMYKVLKVQSSFVKGQFTQVLDLVRMTTYIDDIVPSAVPNPSTAGKLPAGQPDSVKNEVPADSGSASGGNAAPAADPKLIAAGNGPATNDPAQVSGEGTPKENSQPSSAAPGNANNSPDAAPQEKAPDMQSDTFVGLDKLTADYDRLYVRPSGIDTETAAFKQFTAAQVQAAGGGSYYVESAAFNERIQAARLNPNKSMALQEEIKVKIERQVYFEQLVIYTKQAIYDPAYAMDPRPTTFINNVVITSTNGPATGAKVTSNQINELYGQLKTLDPAAAESILSAKPQLNADAKTKALAKI